MCTNGRGTNSVMPEVRACTGSQGNMPQHSAHAFQLLVGLALLMGTALSCTQGSLVLLSTYKRDFATKHLQAHIAMAAHRLVLNVETPQARKHSAGHINTAQGA